MRKGEYGVEGDTSKMEEPPGTSVFSDILQTLGTGNSVGWGDSVKAVKGFPREGLRVKTQGKPQGGPEGFLLFCEDKGVQEKIVSLELLPYSRHYFWLCPSCFQMPVGAPEKLFWKNSSHIAGT